MIGVGLILRPESVIVPAGGAVGAAAAVCDFPRRPVDVTWIFPARAVRSCWRSATPS